MVRFKVFCLLSPCFIDSIEHMSNPRVICIKGHTCTKKTLMIVSNCLKWLCEVPDILKVGTNQPTWKDPIQTAKTKVKLIDFKIPIYSKYKCVFIKYTNLCVGKLINYYLRRGFKNKLSPCLGRPESFLSSQNLIHENENSEFKGVLGYPA